MEKAAVALRFRRLAAAAIDVLAGAALGLFLSQSRVGIYFAERAVVMLHIGSPGTVWKGPIPMIMGYLGTFVYTLPFALLLVFVIEPAIGTSPGKKLMRVTPPAHISWRVAMRRTMPLWGLVVALLVGSWQLALLFLVAGVALTAASLLG